MFPGTHDGDVPITHVTNGVHLPTFLVRAVPRALRPLPRRGLGPARERPADVGAPSRRSRTPSSGHARCAARERLIAYVAAEERARPPAARRADRVRPRRGDDARRRRADARLRAPARALQARLPAHVRSRARDARCSRGEPPVQLIVAGKAHPSDEEGKNALRDVFALKRRSRDGREPDRRPRGLRPVRGARARRGLRRLGQPAAAADGGERDERDEDDVQRRAPAQRARRVVGRGVRRVERLGDRRPRGRRSRRLPTRGTATRSSTSSSTR